MKVETVPMLAFHPDNPESKPELQRELNPVLPGRQIYVELDRTTVHIIPVPFTAHKYWPTVTKERIPKHIITLEAIPSLRPSSFLFLGQPAQSVSLK